MFEPFFEKESRILSTYTVLRAMQILIIDLCSVTEQKYNKEMWFLKISYYDSVQGIINY